MNTICNKMWMQLDCTEKGMELVARLEAISCYGLSIWMKSVMLLRGCGGRYDMMGLIRRHVGPHKSHELVRRVLLASGYFVFNEEMGEVWFSELALGCFGEKKPSDNEDKKSDNFTIDNLTTEQGTTEIGDNLTIDNLTIDNEDEKAEESAAAEGAEREGVPSVGKEQGEKVLIAPPEQRELSHVALRGYARTRKEREKEKIEKKGVERMIALRDHSHTQIERDFYETMARDYPRICSMTHPLMWEDVAWLRQHGFANDTIRAHMDQLENFSRINKYVSARLTLKNWMGLGRVKRKV